jgi:hypothetical protein
MSGLYPDKGTYRDKHVWTCRTHKAMPGSAYRRQISILSSVYPLEGTKCMA